MLDVDYAILGPLTVRTAPDAEPLQLGEKLQLMLTRLLLEPGTTFSVDALAFDVWGDERELANQRNTVHAAVRQLRNRFGDATAAKQIVVSVGSSYRLAVPDPMQIDAERFRQLSGRGSALATDHPHAARAMLEEALATWRGRVLGGQTGPRWIAPYAAELESLRAGAEAQLNEVRLRLGEHVQLEASLRRQVAEHPTDERRRAQLIRALDAAGRTAEAGLAYRDAARELGALGPELRGLGNRIGRGLRATASVAPVVAGVRSGRTDTTLLCAVLERDEPRPGAPDLGMLALLVDRLGGVPHPFHDRGLLATFDDPAAAARAARVLVDDRRLRPALAVHVGPAMRVGERLVGEAVARCRLLARAARPGQALVSGDALAQLDVSIEVHDLGPQRLEDLLADEPIYGLGPDDGSAEAAVSTRALTQQLDNLPVQQTRFVGRDRDLAELTRAVGPGRMITLLGVGGCGKTRLALQLAARRVVAFHDGAWFVDLSVLPDAADVDTVAEAVANQLGVRPLHEEPVPSALSRHLSDRSALLIVDNCEHVVDACVDLLVRLRAAAPRICVVATSRRPLRIDGERVVEVPAMAFEATDNPDVLPDAVELLLERGGPSPDGAHGDQLVADATRICRAFEGSPLAIELAAAHVSTRGLAGVAAEVEAMLRGELGLDYFSSNDPGRPSRQRTIDAAIRWSHALLDDSERVVLHRLATFRGSFGLDEARVVAAEGELGPAAVADVIRRLVDRSMVTVEPPLEDSTRLRLGQPIRAFALTEIDDGELGRARERHVTAYCALATATAPRLFGPHERSALERLEADHDNFRAVLTQLIDARRATEALALAGALWWLWFSHGHFEEGGRWVDAVLALDDQPSRARVRAFRAASHLAWWRGAYAQTDVYNAQLEECARAIGDDWGLAWAPMGFGAVQMFPEPEQALLRFEESRRRFQALGADWEAGYALQLIGAAHWFSGDEASASVAYAKASAIFDEIGHGSVLSSVRRGAGLMAARCGRPEHGAALCADALRISDAIGDRVGSAQALNFMATISRDQGDLHTAIDRFAEALAHARRIGELWATCSALDGLASAACATGDAELATRLFAHSLSLAERAGYRQSAYEQQRRAADLDRLRRTLGKQDFAQAVVEGELMSVGDAVTAALAYASHGAYAPV